MPRCVGKIERGPLHYAYLWKVAQGLTSRPVKFGTIVPDLIGTSIGNDHYAKQEELLFDLCDAMHDELTDLAGAGCAIIQMEEPNIHLVGIQRGGGGRSCPPSSSSRRSTGPSKACATRPKCGATRAGAIRRSSGCMRRTSRTRARCRS